MSRKKSLDYANLSPVEERAVMADYLGRLRAREKRLAQYEPTQREIGTAGELRDKWFMQQANFFRSSAKRRVAFTTRRGGKCSKKDTKVMTPGGPRNIQDLRPGDEVYGWNSDDTVSICRVTELHDQGIQDVVDLKCAQRTVATCTVEHRWLTTELQNTAGRRVRRVSEFYNGVKIVKKQVLAPLGNVDEPHAYALAAFLGNGCCTHTSLTMSSPDSAVVEQVARHLGTEWCKSDGQNYNYRFRAHKGTSPRHMMRHYEQWCHMQRSHEKWCDLDIIKTWNRKSALMFLAGLLDTDGHIGRDGKRLSFEIAMQAESVIAAADYLLRALFMVEPTRAIEHRKKYVNGPLHRLRLSNSTQVARVIKELSPFLATVSKRWREPDDAFAHMNDAYVGVSVHPAGRVQCYDITVDNDTSLYLLANGMVTHNTIGTAIWLVSSLLENPTSLHLYMAQTAGICKLYMWAEIKRLITEYQLPFKTNETDLTVIHERGLGVIVLKGADKADEIEKLRGPKWIKVALDEAASFGVFIENLILEVLGAALMDQGGELIMTGTAGKKKAGIFYEACHELRRRKSDGRPVWELHKWSFKDNPYIPEDAKNEDTIIDDNGFSGVDDPRFLREFRGIWAVGESERVFSGFSSDRDVCDGELPRKHEWKFVLGVDFGWHDESAIVVVAYSNTCKRMYIVDCWSAPRQYADDVASKVLEFKARFGQRTLVYGDLGGYGKGISEHMLRDHGIYVEPAAKRDKLDHIAIINSAFVRQDIKVYGKTCKPLIDQLQQVAWNASRTDMGNHERDDLAASSIYAIRAAKSLGAGTKALNSNVDMDPGTAFAIKEKQDALKKRRPQQTGEPAWLNAEPEQGADKPAPIRPGMWREIVGL